VLDSVGRDVPPDFTRNTALVTTIPKIGDGVSPSTLEISNCVGGSSRPPLPSESQTGDTEYNIPSSDELVPVTPTLGILPTEDKELLFQCVCK
jgi:hypothetical protein